MCRGKLDKSDRDIKITVSDTGGEFSEQQGSRGGCKENKDQSRKSVRPEPTEQTKFYYFYPFF